MKSHNQPMLASVGAWFFEGLAGIQKDPAIPGYRRIIVDPQTVAGLDRAGATRQTIAGEIVSTWSRSANEISLDLTIPVNVTAIVKGHGEVGSGRHRIILRL